MTKVFIDGRAGTTGLRIYERLSARDDIELISLSEEERKNISARKEALNSCDIAFLCLPSFIIDHYCQRFINFFSLFKV